MTTMKRVSVAIPDELDQKILDLKKKGTGRESYSEVVRQILDKGLATIGDDNANVTARPTV